MKKSVLFTLAALAALPSLAIKGTIATESDSKTGDIKWQPRQRSYFITFKQGKSDVNAEFKLADVIKLDIPKPADFDKAVGFVQNKQGSSAIGILQKIVDNYRMLKWDKLAGRYLAQAYIQAGQAQKAYDVCQKIVAEDKEAAWSGDLAPAYWQTLLKVGKTDELEKLLKKAVANGGRPAACAAAVMRGDIIMADGDSPAVTKRALSEGYLKAVLMFNDPECATERREALMKAAEAFDKLGQASRAEKLRNEAKML